MSDSPTPTTSVQVMSRMFALLDVLATESQAVSLKVASERTGLHPSTAHRILNDLAVGGLVERSGPGHYRLGMRLLALGNLVKSRLDVREQAARPMQDLHRLSGHAVSLFVRQEDEAVCVERTVAERHGIHLTCTDGLRAPLTRCAAGKVLLLDEPFGALDAQVRKELRRWLRQLHEELKFTSVFVTHDQEEATEVADRVVVMSQGNIEQADAPDRVWREPATRFVVEFMGEVNRLEGMVRGSQFHVGAHSWPLGCGWQGTAAWFEQSERSAGAITVPQHRDPGRAFDFLG